jgi:hypothetical protein
MKPIGFFEVLKEPASLFFDSEIVKKNWNRWILEYQIPAQKWVLGWFFDFPKNGPFWVCENPLILITVLGISKTSKNC